MLNSVGQDPGDEPELDDMTIAITRRELLRVVGITGESVSRRGGRSLNADAVAAHTDAAMGRSAFVVADGVGNHLLAVRAARTVAAVAAQVGARRGARAAILAAQQELRRQYPQDEADAVLVVAVLPAAGRADGRIDIAWVGDCRAYRWNGRVLHQITTDHTVGEYLRTYGHHPAARMDHLVTTSARTVRPGAVGHAATGSSAGRLLLCTDGVHKPIDMATVKSVLCESTDAAAAAEALVDSALRAGGTDNTTALVVDRG
ncbi:PP2C family serine/threonine-protein phosphatase [Nocardia sp. BMG111209]|uniref:PP2C family protein-serine/threonine phosphatase n=1 Tax=Nocardia sp. BMG111209 TaxID=1160137 RepID=UPI00037E8134|nr:protein phosphatase 2C domain-containing protein [Nocardia sp. BMG111209]